MARLSRNPLSSCLILFAALVTFFALPLPAQTAANITLAFGRSGAGMLQAGDGNLYSASLPIFESCPTDSTHVCSFIYQITESGTITPFYSFQPIANSASPVAPNLDGIEPTALIVGTDGNLYGACKSGGPGGFGTIFQLSLATKKLTLLKSFGLNAAGTAVDVGNQPVSLTQAPDGSFYFTNGIGIYQLTAAGAVNTLYSYPFTASSVSPMGNGSNSIVQGSDGNLYITQSVGPQTTPGTSTQGAISVLNPASGQLTTLHALAADGSEGNLPGGPLVEGSDGAFYGVTIFSGNKNANPGVIFRVTSGGAFTVLHTFAGGRSDIYNSSLILGSDGKLYGTTLAGGDTASTNCTPIGCGTIFQITPAGAFTTLHTFEGGIPTSPVVADNPGIDGASPASPLVQTEGGWFFGNTLGNAKSIQTVYQSVLSPALPWPIEVSLSPSTVGINETATLTWKVLNAFSTTAQQCGAYLGGGAGGGNWSGKQTGSLTDGVYTGTATIKPTAAGSYTYALVCGGKEMGTAQMTVPKGLTITTASLPDALVNSNPNYFASLSAVGGKEPYMWTGTNVPDGLTLTPEGIAAGIPKQFGNYVMSVTVTDSATPPNQVTAPVALNVLSGLKIKTQPATIKATQNATFGLPVNVAGGLPPYTWTITAGTLPDGLQLLGNGSVAGKPTTVGKSTFTLQVADHEATPDTKTITFTLKIVPDIQIAAVEFTQAIQQFQSLDDLEASLTASNEPPVPIISFKRAVMRVYFTRVDKATNVVLSATGDVAGERTFNVPPYCDPSEQRSHESPKQCPSLDIYFTPPSGAWSTVLTLNDDGGNQLEQETLNITSRDALGINLKGVWVCTTPGQPSSCQDPSSLLTMKAFAEKVLPTAAVTADITRIHVAEDVSKYSNDTWVDAVIPKLTALFTPQDILADSSNLQRTDYTGLYNHTLANTATGIADIGNHGVLVPDRYQSFDADVEHSTEETLAHEMGHSLSLTHTGVGGNPNIRAFPGCFATAQIGPPEGTNWTYGDNFVQDSAGYETGFDVLAATVMPARQFFELMSYCEPDWITPLNYKRALLYVNPGPPAAPSLKRPAAIPARPAVAYAAGSYMSVNGTLPSAGGVILNPIFTETMLGTSDQGSGPYSIQLQNAAGQTLYTRYFTPIQGAIDPTLGNTTDAVFTDPMFSEFIPATAGTTAIVIADPTGATLTSLPMTGTPPTVTITSPAGGFAGTGNQTLSWNIQSTASATFTSRIYYSVDAGTTWEQLDETTGMTDVLDFDTLPGASAALIRIDVSDGMNTGSATSAPFSVPRKAPSTIVINSPVAGAVQQAANPVYLTGGAYDTDDGVLKSTALQWSDNAQGSLGSGSPLTVTLKPGSHTITLTATDSDGNALTATTQITLGGAPPVVTLSTAQNSSCYSATMNATPGAQGANLTSVNYSLDGGGTYTGIPLNSLPFTLALNGTGTVNVVAVAVDASGQVSSQSSLVNLGAGCTATTVKASAGSGQSAVVGTAFTTALTTLVVDLNGNPVPGTTVTYAAPATGATASLSAPTATTNASGIATVTATANSIAGSYNVTATATNGTSTATFALTNSDFQIAAATSTLTVPRGSAGTDAITLTALGGFNGSVTFGCSGLPAGATCTFAPATVTPTSATASTTLTIAASQTASLRWPAGGGGVVVCTLLAFFLRRRKYLNGLAIIACAIAFMSLTACGGSTTHKQPTKAGVTVTASVGSVQRTTIITLQIQ